ncbi:MAG: GNAT family N-acetyltransferase [Candidatus Sumerlaeaceae bacterium]
MPNNEPLLPSTWTTSRLHMRPPSLDDAEPIFAAYSSDPEVTRYLSFKCAREVQETREFLEKVAIPRSEDRHDGSHYMITDIHTGELMGSINTSIFGIKAEVGYVLARRFWNQGYMTEALSGLLHLLFQNETIHRVQAFHDAENTASGRVMEKCGMQREGRLRKYAVHPNVSTEPGDCYMWAIVRGDQP